MKSVQTGFSLIEVMVSVLVLSVGIIATAGLQTKSQQFNLDAYLNTQTTILVHDMIERMRANPQGLLHEAAYNDSSAKSYPGCFTLSGCSVEEMAENDLYEWQQDIARKLPNGKGIVCIDSTPDDGSSTSTACDDIGNQYAVKVWWTNKSAETQRVVTNVSF